MSDQRLKETSFTVEEGYSNILIVGMNEQWRNIHTSRVVKIVRQEFATDGAGNKYCVFVDSKGVRRKRSFMTEYYQEVRDGS